MIISSSALLYRKKILHEMAYALDENNISTSIGDDQMSFVDVEVYMEEDVNVAVKPETNKPEENIPEENVPENSDRPQEENNDTVPNPPVLPEQNEDIEVGNEEEIIPDEPYEGEDRDFTFIALGEMMLGPEDATKYDFISSFKNISEYAQNADFTFASLSTNIVKLDKLEDVKNKYIVTADIIKSFQTLGIDAVNVATDHMVDYSKTIFDGTIDILRDNRIDVMGLYNDVVYAENDGIKVAFIGVNNEVIGSYYKYTSHGILMYDDYMTNLKSLISSTKEKADLVVLVTHLGFENSQTVTSVMSWFYRALINAGADIVLGNHALGNYPITIYNGKPIIYSLSYLVTDSKYEEAHKSAMYKFTIDVTGKLKNIEVVPVYSNLKKEALLYSEHNLDEATAFLKYLSQKTYDGVEMKILDGKLFVEFK